MDKIKSFLLEVWLFISSGMFLGTVAKLLGIAVVLFFMTNWWLRCYTDHGESVQVDDFTGMHLADASKKGQNKGFRFEVIDSAWKKSSPSGLIINQTPKALSRVKEGRRIYVTVTGKPKTVVLPLLSESSYDYEQYSRRLAIRHSITSEIKERVYDRKQAENTILHFFHDGQKLTDNDLKKGYKVQEGSTLEFVITERRTNQMNIPDLVCMDFVAADFLVSSYNLNVGQVFEDASVIDRTNAYVYKQEPLFSADATISMGSQINIWLTQDLPADCND
ncbi:MAG: PASTA domain-containing protein [Bacteroidota bacterium]